MIGYEVFGVNSGGRPEKKTGEEIIGIRPSTIWQ